MSVTWLASTDAGYMVGDYIATSFTTAGAHGAFAAAGPPTNNVFAEALYTSVNGLPAARFGQLSSYGERPLRGARSDRPFFGRRTAY